MSNESYSVVDAVPKQLFVGGLWVDSGSKATFPVEDPATGQEFCEVADATPADAAAALTAAADAQPSFAAIPPRGRSEILRRAFEIIVDRIDQLALLMTLEMGKPLAESTAEVLYAAEFFRWFSEEAVRVDGQYGTAPDGASRLLVMRQPVGPCLLITPWNFPLAMGTRKIGPAVAAGCTMVAKPAEQTPLSMLALAQILQEAGLPDGVLNLITTSDPAPATTAMLRDPRLRKLSFTGSTAVGSDLSAQAAANVLRVSLELGGNAPFLVFEDADLEAAVEGAVVAKMRNVGEACTSANRFLVHASIAAEFASRVAGRLGAMRIGPGSDPGTEVGPLIDAAARKRVAALVDDARQRGAQVLIGGDAPVGRGYFYRPTVLAEVSSDSRVATEEIFGPVAPVMTFETDEQALEMANASHHGLVSYAYTRDLARAVRVCESLEAGMVGLNRGMVSNPAAPFGGIKHSGIGREGGHEGLAEYLSVKYVAVGVG